METIKLEDVVEFNAGRRVRKRLLMTEKIEMELVCYEPGQGTPEHHHVGQDEIFLVIEGTGRMTVDGEAIAVGPGSIVFAPAQSKHSIEADSRLTLVFTKAPGRASPERRGHKG